MFSPSKIILVRLEVSMILLSMFQWLPFPGVNSIRALLPQIHRFYEIFRGKSLTFLIILFFNELILYHRRLSFSLHLHPPSSIQDSYYYLHTVYLILFVFRTLRLSN